MCITHALQTNKRLNVVDEKASASHESIFVCNIPAPTSPPHYHTGAPRQKINIQTVNHLFEITLGYKSKSQHGHARQTIRRCNATRKQQQKCDLRSSQLFTAFRRGIEFGVGHRSPPRKPGIEGLDGERARPSYTPATLRAPHQRRSLKVAPVAYPPLDHTSRVLLLKRRIQLVHRPFPVLLLTSMHHIDITFCPHFLMFIRLPYQLTESCLQDSIRRLLACRGADYSIPRHHPTPVDALVKPRSLPPFS